MKQTILLVEDDPVQRAVTSLLLSKKLGYEVVEVAGGKEALNQIKSSQLDSFCAVLLDITMPEMDGFETLKIIRTYYPHLPVLMLTASTDTSAAVRAIKEGANDFITKPPEPAHLDIALKNAVRLASMARELTRLKRDREGALGFSDLVGFQEGLAGCVAYSRKAAASDVPVLIQGETGTGKELLARAIHGESRRVGAPFIAVNCGAIPENLVESILFGHEKGSFTGATTRTLGKFREAEGGTLFLDEVSELPLDAQVKLLRALQQKEVEPVGAGKPVKVNARIISATHRDLKQEVSAGRFREDLYFRLNVLPVTVPPLRERRQDILLLARHFMERCATSDMLALKFLERTAEDYLIHHAWPGNVRELENLLRRALVLYDTSSLSKAQMEAIHETSLTSVISLGEQAFTLRLQHPGGRFKTMEELEAEAIHAVLEHYEGNITRASDALGIAKSTFYRKIKQAG